LPSSSQDVKMSMTHVSARQELRSILQAIGEEPSSDF